jgi:hypothetical protein
MASLSITKTGDNSYQWTISGLSLPFNTTNYLEAGITDASFSNNVANLPGAKTSSVSATSTGTSYSVSGTFVLTVNGTYTFYGFTRATNYYYYTAGSVTITHTNPGTTRPSNFSWEYPKTGDLLVIGKDEWNNFRARVNEFRIYKGLGSFSYSQAIYDGDMSASSFRDCANAIYHMTASVASACRNVQSNDRQYPWYFENLKEALNSIT